MHEPSTTNEELHRLLLENIRLRAGGRVRELDMHRVNGSVIVRGKADSYYAWQLTIAACQQVLSRNGDRRVHLDCALEVVKRNE